MNVTQDLSILHLILQASAVVQLVMALLAGVSLMSWYYIAMKWFAVKQARSKTEQFERDFWSAATSTISTRARSMTVTMPVDGTDLRGRIPRIHQTARTEELRFQGHR